MKRLLSILSILLLTACVDKLEDTPYDTKDFQNGGANAPELNERTMEFMKPDNQYSNIEGMRPKTEQEKKESTEKWNSSRMDTHWQEYKGAMVRVQIILGNSDMREMRLKYMQNANGGDIDGDMRDILDKVADFEMKKVCGKRTESIVIVYDKASFEAVRPTPFFDYKADTDGSAMREYGFRCIYYK